MRILALLVTCACLSFNSVALAQFQIAQPQTVSGPIYFNGNWQNNRNQFIWDNAELLRQIEITRDQRREFFELKMDYEDATRELNERLKKLQRNTYEMVGGKWIPKENAQSEINETQEELQGLIKEYKEEAKKVLLPHQQGMLERVNLRKGLNNQRLTSLVNRKLDGYLELTDKQKESIQKIAREEHERLQAQMLKGLKSTEKRLMRELSKEQKERFDELVGDLELADKLVNNFKGNYWLFSYESWFTRKKKD